MKGQWKKTIEAILRVFQEFNVFQCISENSSVNVSALQLIGEQKPIHLNLAQYMSNLLASMAFLNRNMPYVL